LYGSLDLQKRVMDNHAVILLKQLWGDDDVRDTGFVFQAQEDKSFRRAGTLPDNHRSDYFHRLAVGKMLQDAGGRNSECVQLSAMVSERMWAYGQASAAKIREDAFLRIHRT
jgi:hypothetical protein